RHAGMTRTIRRAAGSNVVAEGEVGSTHGANWPAALARREVKQGTGLRAHHTFGNRFQCEQRFKRHPLSQHLGPPHWWAHAHSGRGCAPAARKAETTELTYDGIAGNTNLVGDLSAG